MGHPHVSSQVPGTARIGRGGKSCINNGCCWEGDTSRCCCLGCIDQGLGPTCFILCQYSSLWAVVVDKWLLCLQVLERMSGRRQEQRAPIGQDVSGGQAKSAALDDDQIGWDDDDDDDMFGGPRF